MCDERQVREILQEVMEFSQQQFGESLDSVILYGSYARGDYDEESDIDVMILVNSDEEYLKTFSRVYAKFASCASLKHEMFLSLVLRSKSTFDHRKTFVPYYRNVMNEGVVYNG
ncbi:MAG: nucleotidyltransferase domain-containing protein [Thermoguttaceae bacterium]